MSMARSPPDDVRFNEPPQHGTIAHGGRLDGNCICVNRSGADCGYGNRNDADCRGRERKTWFRVDPGVLRSSAKERVRERGRDRPELRSPACVAVEMPSPSVLLPAQINPWKSGLSLGCEFGWGRRVQPHRSADPACKVHFLLVPPPHVRVVHERLQVPPLIWISLEASVHQVLEFR